VNIPVIASGGAGSQEHFREVFAETGCTAALAATLFHYGIIKIPELKKYLLQNNIDIRC
jgi:cyclase